MKIKNNIIIIIPALAKNRYSKYGDLHKWGDTNLLEWKISEAKKIKNHKEIYVATPDNLIKKKCKEININILPRAKNENLNIFFQKLSQKFSQNFILILTTTSPFLSSKTIMKALNRFDKVKDKYDSMCTVQKKTEYFLYKNKPLNFDFEKTHISRSKIKSIDQLSNGMFLINPKKYSKKIGILGNKSLFFRIDWLSSLEISSFEEMETYEFLINNYFNKNLA